MSGHHLHLGRRTKLTGSGSLNNKVGSIQSQMLKLFVEQMQASVVQTEPAGHRKGNDRNSDDLLLVIKFY